MRRRTFLAGLGATFASTGMAAPAIAQSAKARTLTYVPPAGLLILDPHFTTINQTVYYGHCVYDQLYSVDSRLQAVPQMAEGHVVSADNLTWTIKLRAGLKFHDGERVRAKDCVASIKRWAKRDAFGTTMMSYVDEIAAVDDDTLRFRLKKPFGILPDALAHPTASPCVIMPERIAAADITQQVTETIGSGPLKFVRDEFVPGQRAVFARNPDYVPRNEKADGMAGGKVMHFDRVEWKALPDNATAAAALQAGEVDWWDSVYVDLVPLLKTDPRLTVTPSDAGYKNWIRFNNGTAPFNNVALRRAVAAAMDQVTFTQALTGEDKPATCFAVYKCGAPGIEELGKPLMGGPKDFKALAAKVKEAGYNGEKVVLISATDIPTVAPMAPIVVDTLKKLGMNVELQTMDLNTMVTRRASQATVEQGGWSIFTFLTATPTIANPVAAVIARGLGAKGYPGNNDDPTLEAAITGWIEATSDAERQARLATVHQRLWDTTPIVPIANYAQYTAFRADLTGYLQNAVAVPWNIRRA
jgi:peptide/nickel transport system substrate-binding protein